MKISQKIKKAVFTPDFSIRNVFFSLALGFLVAWVTLCAMYGFAGANYILVNIFSNSFTDTKSTARLFDKIVILGFAGLAVLVGNKAGLLNIGVSGQMMFGAFAAYFVVRTVNADSIYLSLFIGLIVTAIVGSVIALISGILKVFFKVNEVISTIMMNWIVVYLIRFLASNKKMSWYNSSSTNKIELSYFGGKTQGNLQLLDGTPEITWIFAGIGIVLFIFSVLIMWVLYSKTQFGFKVRATGLSSSVSEYAGYNSKKYKLISMGISGIFAGMAGFTMYFLSRSSITATVLPIGEGFAGIAIALVALNNPIGVVASAALFGLISGPTSGVVMGTYPSQMVQIFTGIITYFVAATTLWLYIRPINLYRNLKKRHSENIQLNKGVV